MNPYPLRLRAASSRQQGGFTLIEVLITILVMAFGLLGFALLQTMSVRLAQSANYRTQSTNLAYELLDQIRANRVRAVAYYGDYAADITPANCSPKVGNGITSADYKVGWECRLGKALGEGATAKVTQQAGGELKVDITWGDDRWVAGAASRTFSAVTRL